MNLLQWSPSPVFIGLVMVFCTAAFRFHYPFRYRYLAFFFRNSPKIVYYLLQRSFLKNRTAVGLLDKGTKEILEGKYTEAEQSLIQGIELLSDQKGIRNQLIRTFLFTHLSWNFYYKGDYRESLEIAIRLYERIPTNPRILALIICNLARFGEIAKAMEAQSKLSRMKKTNTTLLLSCQAEIEAAVGNPKKAVQLLIKAKGNQTNLSICFIHQEIEKRIVQLNKSA